MTNPQNGSVATQIANYKKSVDGRFADITSLIAGKVNQTDFQRVKETSQLYERIIGRNENDIADKVARMALTNQLFQVEVSKNEGLKTVQRQLAGSWSVQNINSAGDIISGINLGANGHNRFVGKLTHITGETLIDNAVIKSAMVDQLKTANFEAGSVTTTILDAEAVTAEKLKVDNALIRKLTANEAFIDQLTSKRIFATKVESVISSSTVLEGYKGWIGGFQLGTHDSGYGRWITGRNQFSVGMGNGEGGDGRTALWVNWGYNWSEPGYYAWFVKNNGKMYCYNTAEFWKTPIIHGDLKVTGNIIYDGGTWLYSRKYSHIESSGGSLYLYHSSGYDWIIMNKDVSDRRYKTNVKDSAISGLDIINNLKTYSYRKEYDGKTTDISCGIMAQDVQKYAPEAFFENPDGAYSYRTFELVPYLIKAIQELNQKIEKMEKTIA
ncbi:MAG: tail fiber domain-containing protein [Streptococcus sp.]|nr:MAG: tail fiber domain-containing protein [Streptococcus sp.]